MTIRTVFLLTTMTTMLAPHVAGAQDAAGAQSAKLTDRPATMDEYLRLGERPRVIAHRGFSSVAPENTLVALRRAIEIGADMAEIDVGLTSDGEVVLMHDKTLDRTTDGKGLLSKASFEEVRKLDAGSWFSSEFAGERVPTLAEALDLVHGKILFNIEIKGEAVTDQVEGGIADKVLTLVRERDMFAEVVLSSFEPKALKHARRLDPDVKTASLFNRKLHRGMSPIEVMTDAGSNAFNVSVRKLRTKTICASHRYGRPLAVYTVNDEDVMRHLIRKGVHGFFTDRPDVLIRVVAGLPQPWAAAAGGC